jgi:hypothetical protein
LTEGAIISAVQHRPPCIAEIKNDEPIADPLEEKQHAIAIKQVLDRSIRQ